MKSNNSVIVSWDFSHGKDVSVLVGGGNYQRLSRRGSRKIVSKTGISKIAENKLH